MIRRFIVLLAALIAVTACSPEEAELTTTTTLAASTTSTTSSTTTSTTTSSSGTSAEPAEPAITDYEVIVRSGTADGEVLWVLIEPGDYNDVDLENFIRELVDESDIDLYEVHVFDDAAALEAGRVAEDARTGEEQTLVDGHHLVSLVEGAVIRFQGPFSDLGETSVGS